MAVARSELVHRRGARIVIVVALAAVLLIVPAAYARPGSQADQTNVLADVGAAPVGQPMPPGFVGVSVEYWGSVRLHRSRPRRARSGAGRAAAPARARPGTGAADRRRQHRRDMVAGARRDPTRRRRLPAHARLAGDHAGARPGARGTPDHGHQCRRRSPGARRCRGASDPCGHRPPVHRGARNRQRAGPLRGAALVSRPAGPRISGAPPRI